MHHLLDVVVDLPALLAQSDRLNDEQISFTERMLDQQRLWVSMTGLERRLLQWRKDWADRYPSGQPCEVARQRDDPFPIFCCRDTSAGTGFLQPQILDYPDPQLARTLCMYYASFLVFSSIDTRPENAIQRDQQYEWACLICRTMQYYIRTVPGNMINRMAFPLSVAYRALPQIGPEREFAREIFHMIKSKNRLKLWARLDVNL